MEIGAFGLFLAFAGTIVSIVCFLIGYFASKSNSSLSETMAWAGRMGIFVSTLALTFCCAILVWAFFTGDLSLEYVLDNYSKATGPDRWLYQLAGLWAGRQGSLLFWAWLISVFSSIVALRTAKDAKLLDSMALLVVAVVLLAFVSVLLFSTDNLPFVATDPHLFNEDGTLGASASVYGMNTLLEHWAMAIHPPTLFIGYAGLTIPFAYALGALIVNDDSSLWVVRSTPYALFSWLFLGFGIGLGAIWAYVVLGWGGYWGWDPVENASLLPWLLGVALIHSFTVYRQRNRFKRWSVMAACLTFVFVILGTFITRSGLVQSVHAFEGDPVSLLLFLGLIIVSLAAGVLGLILRRKTFGVSKATTEASPEADESLLSRDAAYYFNNLIMVVFAVLLTYMTLSSALPEFLPFGGQSLSAGTFDAIARPVGIAYGLLIAVCPLLGWRRTSGKTFWKQALIPGIGALVLFVLLVIYFCTYLLPSYEAMVLEGGSVADGIRAQGPAIYYNGLALVGFAVASLLFFNGLFMALRAIRQNAQGLRRRLSLIGGSICHASVGIILIGLIGSSMYVTENQTYVAYDKQSDTADSLVIQDFELIYTSNSVTEEGSEIYYVVNFDVYKGGSYVGAVSPSVQLTTTTQQQKLNAAVLGFPLEDLFVVYRGVNSDGDFSMDVRVNPLISVVWIGFILLMAGALVSLFARRGTATRTEPNHG